MTKAEYLEQLRHKLRVLPPAELQDALDYYDGYLSDAEDEGLAISQLGSPGEAAANILADYVAKEPAPMGANEGAGGEIAGTAAARAVVAEVTRSGGIKTAWVIILALFAVPIGLPVVIAVGAVAFALFFVLFSVLLSVGMSGVVFLLSGVVGLAASVFVAFQDFGFSMLLAGMGLASLGLGILCARFTTVVMRGFPMIARFVGRRIRRKRHA